jgi:hypothetical protein
MLIRFLLLSMLLVLGACSTKEPSTASTPKPLPSWYVNPPQNDSRWLYATGEGVDRQAALADALNMMAAGLSVTIDSHYQSKATQTRTKDGEQGRFHSDSTIRADVEKIRISDFDVLESTEQSFRKYIILIRAERARIASSVRKELETTYAQLHNREASLGKNSTLARYLFYRDVQKNRAQREQLQRILTLLVPRQDISGYLEWEKAFERRYFTLSKELCFNLRAQTPLAKQLLPVLREGLNTEKLHTVEKDANRRCLTLQVNTHENRAMSMGLYLARTEIALETRDEAGNIVASRTLHLVGQSSQGYAIAQSNVAVKLKKSIQREGIFAVMGIQE